MKRIFILVIISALIIFSEYSIAQDFNLYIPSNESYLFSAYDEGANAFRYNPAVLGLGHKFNGSLNLFLENYRTDTRITEYDLLLNSGILGLAYRQSLVSGYQQTLNILQGDLKLHTFSFALGFGNKTFSAGLLAEWLRRENNEKPVNYFEESLSKFKFGLGFLFRPNSFISTALNIRTNESFDPRYDETYRIILGAGVRPLRNNMVNLLFDFGFTPYSDNFAKENFIKAGTELRFRGFGLSFNYTKYNGVNKRENFNAGVSINFPNTGVRYNNIFSRNNSSGLYNENNSLKTWGSMFSFSFFSEKRQSIISPAKNILELTLGGGLQDYSTDAILFGILGGSRRSIHEIIADIDYAAKDPATKGMIVKIYPLSSGLFPLTGEIEELADAFTRFRKQGKNITAYFPDDVSTTEYYLATYADEIIMPDEGMLWYGLNVDVMNFRQFLQKYGVELQNIYAGKYKLTFQGLLDSTSEEGKVVINRVLDILYDKMLKRLTDSRQINVTDELKKKISHPIMGAEALRLGLVDKTGWYSEAKDISERNSKLEGRFRGYVNRNIWDEGWSEPDRIAVIGVFGSITSGESQAPDPIQIPIPFTGRGRSTGSETVVKQLENAFADPKVKAIVLRVDSGGGSALASAEINSAIKRLKSKYKKLFIVSMGGAAASGGYYVSANADRIFADATTVTGSIGVFASIPNLDSLLKDQKVKVESFKRGEYSDMSVFRPLTDDEIAIIQGIINFYYDQFIKEVSEGRNISREQADEIAQGRVWLGEDAFRKNLVDQIGGLYESLNYVRLKTKLNKRHTVVYYPVPGGDKITQLVNASIVEQYGRTILDMLEIDKEQEEFPDIKY